MTDLVLNFKALGVGQLTKVVQKLEESNEKFGIMKEALKDNSKLLGSLADNKITRFFDVMNNKIYDLGRSSTALKDIGGPMGLLSAKLQESNALLVSMGGTTVLSKLKIVGALLSSWLVPLAAIAAGIWIFTRLWKENIGGIQTKWIAFMGKLKNTWSKFEVTFRKFLHQIEPIFTYVFDNFFSYLGRIFVTLKTVLVAVMKALQPIIKVFSSIFTSFNKEGNNSIGLLGVLVKSFEMLGKVIVIVLKPIAWLAKIVATLVKEVFKFLSIVKKAFSFSITNSPLFKGIKLVQQAIGWMFNKNNEETSSESEAVNRATDSAVLGRGNVSGVDNRSAKVTIYANNLDERIAKDIGNNFISPVLDANKQI